MGQAKLKKTMNSGIVHPYSNRDIPITKEVDVSDIGKDVKEAQHITSLATKKFTFSYIEDYEEEEAIKAIEDHLGFQRPRVTGYHLAVKIYMTEKECKKYTHPDGRESMIYMPETSQVLANQQFTSCVGLVLAVGPWAYKGERFNGQEPWCKVADWVVIPRHEGLQVNYRGMQLMYIADDRVMDVISDPEHVKRI